MTRQMYPLPTRQEDSVVFRALKEHQWVAQDRGMCTQGTIDTNGWISAVMRVWHLGWIQPPTTADLDDAIRKHSTACRVCV